MTVESPLGFGFMIQNLLPLTVRTLPNPFSWFKRLRLYWQCINDSRSLDAIQPAACLNVVMMWLFIYCYFGDQVTSRFSDITDTLYLCDWHLLPLHTQKNVPMMILAAQRFVHIKGFASSSCSRESFKKVWTSLLSFNPNTNWIQINVYKFFSDCKRWFLIFHNASTSEPLK